MEQKKKHIYAYVDESGQDTRGVLFVVGVVVLEEHREEIQSALEAIEKRTKKKNVKWHKSRPIYRQAYIDALLHLPHFRQLLFFEIFSDSKKYIELTSYATAKAVLKKSGDNYKATIYVDGFRRKEIEVFTRGLRDLHIRTKKIRGVKRDENNAFIRLADALCGLVRDANDETPWAMKALRQLQEKNIVVEL